MNMAGTQKRQPGGTRSRAGRSIALLAFVTLLAGCASSQTQDGAGRDSRKAAESNTALGLEYMNRGQYEVALGKLKKALSEEPDYAPAHTVTAVLYERIGERDLAGRHYRKAYEAAPKNGDVNNNYGVYLCQEGSTDKALDHFGMALDDPFYTSPYVALANAGSCALGNKRLDEADEYLRAALKIDPRFPDALLAMAELNAQRKNYLKSRAFIQRYEAVSEHSASSLLLAFRVETELGDRKAARRYLQSLESEFPDSGELAEARRSSGS